MAWKKLYWDLIFLSLACLTAVVYHCWLWQRVKKHSHRTIIGVCTSGQNVWIAAMLKDNDKKNILAVQTLRNYIMGSSLVASSSFLICAGLLAFTSTISDKRQLVMTSLNQFEVSHKCAVLILTFMTVFFCQTLSITFLNQVCMVVNTLIMLECKVTEEQVSLMLGKGMLLGTIGNRFFFAAMPLILWIYSPVLVFASSVGVVAALYSTDVVPGDTKAVTDENTGSGERTIAPQFMLYNA